MKKIIIAAVSQNNIIGKNGSIPWNSKSELAHFKKMTTDFPVLMGRKTYNSLDNKPLTERVNIVLSKDEKFSVKRDDVIIKRSIKEVYNFCIKKEFAKLFIIGGGEVFKSTIIQVDQLIISRMNFAVQGDVYFPNIDLTKWEIYNKEEHEGYVIEKFRRIPMNNN